MSKIVTHASFTKLAHAIRKQCIECFGGQRSEVEFCTSPKCNIYPFRRGITQDKKNTLAKLVEAIRKHCLECVGYVKKEVENCTGRDCSLYPHRLS